MFEIANEHGFIDELLSISKKLIKWWYENQENICRYTYIKILFSFQFSFYTHFDMKIWTLWGWSISASTMLKLPDLFFDYI